jgi:hypothetical protein
MKIDNNGVITYVEFNESHTEATLTRMSTKIIKVTLPEQYMTVRKIAEFVALDDDSFKALAQIQEARKNAI